MKTEIHYALGDAARLNEPAVSPGTSCAAYIQALTEAADNQPGKEPFKARVCINAMERYLNARKITSEQLQYTERVLAQIHADMRSGRFRTRKRKTYQSMAKHFVGSIRRVHDSLVGTDPQFLRTLLDHRRYERYANFLQFSDTTQQAMIWFEQHARVKTKHGRGAAMTQRSRNTSIASAFTVLKRLKLTGLEAITGKAVIDALGVPDSQNPEYRALMRNTHNLRPLFRACVEEGLLPTNPLTEVPDEKFDHQAVQDFLLPDEMNKLRDLQTVDMNNEIEVRDRLTCLIYADAAMRKTELAKVTLSQVRSTGRKLYTLELDSDGQKMSNKSRASIPLLYPETGELLDYYLQHIRPKHRGDALIVNDRGQPASGEVCARQVTREAKRIGVTTYHKKKPPSPHDLRRTFATLNIESLGLGLSLFDMAERLRDSVNVVMKHYIQGNPILQEHKATALRKKAHSQDDPETLLEHLAALQAAGLPFDSLADARQAIEARMAPPEPEESKDVEANEVDWIPYPEGLELLQTTWEELPYERKLRDHLRKMDALSRKGKGGHLHVDRNAIQSLANDHLPLNTITDTSILSESIVRSIQRRCKTFRIGSMIVLKKEDSLVVTKLLAKALTRAVYTQHQPDGNVSGSISRKT